MARVNYPELKLIRYHCKAKTGLVKNRCNEKTGLSTKIVRFFQDDTVSVGSVCLSELLLK